MVKVLLIEDNEMNANVLRENLLYAGYTYTLATNGAAGVASAAEQLPDIILMDVNLPLIDGLTATKVLKKHNVAQGIPIIALTAKAMIGDRENCLAAGCDDYISKPVDMDILLAKMKHHLDKRPPAFVDMLRRMRIAAERSKNQNKGAEPPADQPPQQRAADKLANLILTMERLEAELALSKARALSLDDLMAEQNLKLSALAQERDAAKAEAKREAARAMRLTAELDALWVNPDGPRSEIENTPLRPAQAAERSTPSPTARRSTDEELIEESARNRKLAHRLKAAQEKIAALQRQLESASLPQPQPEPPDNERLRRAFLQLHGAVASAAAEAKRAASG